METSQPNAIEGSSQKEDEHVNATDVANEGSSENVDKKKRGGKRSWVWDHFILEHDGKATCPYCKTKMASNSKKNGTGSLIGHLEKVCTLSPVYRKVDQRKQSTLNFKPVVKGEKGSVNGIDLLRTPNTAEALICTQDWIRSTPADLNDTPVNGIELQTLVENLEKLEIDELLTGEKHHEQSDDDW